MTQTTLFINGKSYRQAFSNMVEIARASAAISRETGVEIIVLPPVTLLRDTAKYCKTFAQHMDPIEHGSSTGKLGLVELKDTKASGAMFNHSEDKQPQTAVMAGVSLLEENNMQSLVLAPTVHTASRVLKSAPTYAGFEPPALIGGAVAASVAKKEEAKEFVKLAKDVDAKPIIGAAIRTDADVSAAIDIGMAGVLVSSEIMLSANPAGVVKSLAGALRKGL